jgi:hypothetical protein
MNADKCCDLIYDHYKDTSTRLSDEIKARLRFAAYIFVILGSMVLEMYQPGVFSDVLHGLLKKSTGSEATNFGQQAVVGFVNALLWVLLAFFLLQTFLRSLEIERYARYLRKMESQLEEMLGGRFINREREFKAPFFRISSLAFMPMFFFSVAPVVIIKFYLEIRSTHGEPLIRWIFTLVDAAMLLIIVGFGTAFVFSFAQQIRQSSADNRRK